VVPCSRPEVSVAIGRIVRRFHPLGVNGPARWRRPARPTGGGVVRSRRDRFPRRLPLRSYGTGNGPGRRTMRREGKGGWRPRARSRLLMLRWAQDRPARPKQVRLQAEACGTRNGERAGFAMAPPPSIAFARLRRRGAGCTSVLYGEQRTALGTTKARRTRRERPGDSRVGADERRLRRLRRLETCATRTTTDAG